MINNTKTILQAVHIDSQHPLSQSMRSSTSPVVAVTEYFSPPTIYEYWKINSFIT